MSVVDILETEFKLKDNYTATANKIKGSTLDLGSAMGGAASLSGGFAAALGIATAALAGMGVVAAGAFAAMKEGAAFSSLETSLKAVEGNAKNAADAMARLKEIAKNPGIGFEEAVRGYAGLRRGGASADMSARLVESAGNANAYAGGDVQKFEQIMRAFSQILTKPYLQGDELLQLSEAGLPGAKMIRDKFGTADGGELKKMGVTSAMAVEALLEAMDKLPKVAGGAQNSLDNFNDAIKFAVVDFGQSLNTSFMPVLDSISGEIGKLVSEGYFQTLGESFAELTMKLTDGDPALKLREFAGAIQTMADVLNGDAVKNIVGSIKNALEISKLGTLKKAFDFVFEKVTTQPDPFGDTYNKLTYDSAQAENEAYFKKLGYNPEDQKKRLEAQAKAREDAKKAEEAKKKEEAEKDSPAVRILKKIEENTKVLPDFQRLVIGGGELGRLGVTATEVRGKPQAQKVMHGLHVLGGINAAGMNRKLARNGA